MAKNCTHTAQKATTAFSPTIKISQLQPKGFGLPQVATQEPVGFNASQLPLFPPVQTKLTVGAPNDKYEQEADAVAAKVVERINSPQLHIPQQNSSGAGAVQRQAVLKKEPLKPPSLQRKGGEAIAAPMPVEPTIADARGQGQGLDDGTRGKMEGAFGADFGGVRVHTDERADGLNRSLQSRAFATGQDIFFKRGEFNPGSRSGQELLAHELTHVVQQSKGFSASHKVQRRGARPSIPPANRSPFPRTRAPARHTSRQSSSREFSKPNKQTRKQELIQAIADAIEQIHKQYDKEKSKRIIEQAKLKSSEKVELIESMLSSNGKNASKINNPEDRFEWVKIYSSTSFSHKPTQSVERLSELYTRLHFIQKNYQEEHVKEKDTVSRLRQDEHSNEVSWETLHGEGIDAAIKEGLNEILKEYGPEAQANFIKDALVEAKKRIIKIEQELAHTRRNSHKLGRPDKLSMGNDLNSSTCSVSIANQAVLTHPPLFELREAYIERHVAYHFHGRNGSIYLRKINTQQN